MHAKMITCAGWRPTRGISIFRDEVENFQLCLKSGHKGVFESLKTKGISRKEDQQCPVGWARDSVVEDLPSMHKALFQSLVEGREKGKELVNEWNGICSSVYEKTQISRTGCCHVNPLRREIPTCLVSYNNLRARGQCLA